MAEAIQMAQRMQSLHPYWAYIFPKAKFVLVGWRLTRL